MAEKNGSLRMTVQQLAMLIGVAAGSTAGYRVFVEPKVSQAETVMAPEIVAVEKENMHQDEIIGDMLMRQIADHDAITTLTADVKYIRESVGKIERVLTSRPGP